MTFKSCPFQLKQWYASAVVSRATTVEIWCFCSLFHGAPLDTGGQFHQELTVFNTDSEKVLRKRTQGRVKECVGKKYHHPEEEKGTAASHRKREGGGKKATPRTKGGGRGKAHPPNKRKMKKHTTQDVAYSPCSKLVPFSSFFGFHLGWSLQCAKTCQVDLVVPE